MAYDGRHRPYDQLYRGRYASGSEGYRTEIISSATPEAIQWLQVSGEENCPPDNGRSGRNVHRMLSAYLSSGDTIPGWWYLPQRHRSVCAVFERSVSTADERKNTGIPQTTHRPNNTVTTTALSVVHSASSSESAESACSSTVPSTGNSRTPDHIAVA